MRIQRLVVIVLFVLVLPVMAVAKKSQISSFTSTEFNFLNSGSSLFWPVEYEFNSQDRQKLFWKNNLNFNLESDYLRLYTNVSSFADSFSKPSSLGLEATALLPFELLVEGLRVGLYHQHGQNLVDGCHDRNTQITGLHLNFDFPEYIGNVLICQKDQWGRVFVNYNFIHQDRIAYLLTRHTKTGFVEDEDCLKWTFGLVVGQDTGILKSEQSVIINFSEKNIASLMIRREDLMWIYHSLYAGILAGYNRNLGEMKRFGRDEWILGTIFKIYLKKNPR